MSVEHWVEKAERMKTVHTSDDLAKLSKEELETRVQQLEAHVYHLKNVIRKQNGECKTTSLQKAARPFDFSKHRTRHILLQLTYLGWDYEGYAIQECSNETIEYYLFEALCRSCLIESREKSHYHRCGRTDKGVSAFCQVISINLRSCLPPENEQDIAKELPYCKLLNRLLPPEIRAIAWCPAPREAMSARFDCTRRTYHYIFPRSNLDLELMQKAATYLIGSHDFRNFCKMDVGSGVVDHTRVIFSASIAVISSTTPGDSWTHQSKDEKQTIPNDVGHSYDLCELVVTGKAFLWHQIRFIVSVLMLVGKKLEKPEVILSLLDVTTCPRKPQYEMALEFPLTLFQCDYDEPLNWHFDQQELARVVGDLQQTWANYSVKASIVREMVFALDSKLEQPVFKHVESFVKNSHCKAYKPLLKRDTSLSLENRIEHYVKKRKIRVMTNAPAAPQMPQDHQ